MYGKQTAIHLRSSATKLLPAFFVCVGFAVMPTAFLIIGIFAMISDQETLTGEVSIGLTALAVPSLLFWYGAVRTARRISEPDRLQLDVEGLQITKLGRHSQYRWDQLGSPVVCYRSPKSHAQIIKLPVSGKRWRHLVIEADQFEHSVSDIKALIEYAQIGELQDLPVPENISAYRYFALPSSLFTASIFPILVLYLYSR